jgi:hypothetical protein
MRWAVDCFTEHYTIPMTVAATQLQRQFMPLRLCNPGTPWQGVAESAGVSPRSAAFTALSCSTMDMQEGEDRPDRFSAVMKDFPIWMVAVFIIDTRTTAIDVHGRIPDRHQRISQSCGSRISSFSADY